MAGKGEGTVSRGRERLHDCSGVTVARLEDPGWPGRAAVASPRPLLDTEQLWGEGRKKTRGGVGWACWDVALGER